MKHVIRTYVFWEEFAIFILHCPVLSKYIVKLVYHWKRGDRWNVAKSAHPFKTYLLVALLHLGLDIVEQSHLLDLPGSRLYCIYITLPGRLKVNLSDLPTHFAFLIVFFFYFSSKCQTKICYVAWIKSCFDHFSINNRHLQNGITQQTEDIYRYIKTALAGSYAHYIFTFQYLQDDNRTTMLLA